MCTHTTPHTHTHALPATSPKPIKLHCLQGKYLMSTRARIHILWFEFWRQRFTQDYHLFFFFGLWLLPISIVWIIAVEIIESFCSIEYITLEIVGNVDNCLLLDSQIIYKLVRFEKKKLSQSFISLASSLRLEAAFKNSCLCRHGSSAPPCGHCVGLRTQ